MTLSTAEKGTLYVVATPIGNLEDITFRAVRILKEVDVIVAEDTRVTKKLCTHYAIPTRIESLNARTESAKMSHIVALLGEGKNIALVSDAGTPTISDPGARLVAHAREAGNEVIAIPGASALTAALSIAGVPASEFIFLGFLPHKKGRTKYFNEIKDAKRTVVLYESPHRILKTLTALEEICDASRRIVIARELTKIHEEVVSGTPREVRAYFEEHQEKVRGEFVVIVSR